MARIARVYFALVVSAAVLLLLALPKEGLLQLSSRDWHGLFWFVVVSLVAEAAAVDFKLGPAPQAKSSIAFIPFLSAAVLFPPLVTALSVVSVIAVSQFLLRQQQIEKGLFNVAQVTIAVGVAAAVFHYNPVAVNSPQWYLTFVLLAGIFFALNILLSSLAIAAMRGERISSVVSKVVGPAGSNLWYDFLYCPIALVPAALYEQVFVGGLFMMVLPLLVVRSSYLSKRELQAANRDLLEVLVKAIETRDPYTSGHSRRVSTLAGWIACELNVAKSLVAMFEHAALLHDIGKIDAAYSRVIAKPSDLAPGERQLIESHAERGADLLRSLSSVDTEVVNAVLHHHERWDGRGYPEGLAGDTIPMASRIIMVCDSVDAMLSDRPYRKALGVDTVAEELRKCAGTQFDPEIVNAVLRSTILKRANELVRAENSGQDAQRRLAAVI